MQNIIQSIDLSRATGIFVKDLFSNAKSNYLENLADDTKANRLINGTDKVNANMVRTFPSKNDVESVTNFLNGKISSESFNKLANKFGIKHSREKTRCLAYALAKEFFNIVKTAGGTSIEDDTKNMNYWYNESLNQPLIYKNTFDGEFKDSLYQESGKICPVTGKRLNSSNTEIIEIYQSGLDNSVKDNLAKDKIEEPEQEFSINNCLAVHSEYAHLYNMIHKNDPNEIKRLFQIKEKLKIKNYGISSGKFRDTTVAMKTLIMKISTSSLSKPKASLVVLNYDPVDVDKKIPDDELLATIVKSNSNTYYKKIKNWFINAEASFHSEVTKHINKNIKEAYLECSKTFSDKRTIVDFLADWVIKECGVESERDKYNLPAKIIVYFFIQSCEVFKK